ncbi:hypothetical protein BH23BAC1_BH23BAC1_17920 [soil metagenome]
MTQLSTVYIIHASDAPQHLGKLKEILFKLKTENRIGSINSLDEDYDFSAINEKIKDGDLVITLLTDQLEPQKLRIENRLGALKIKRPEIKVAEIIVDNLTYDNDYITFPSDLKPIRSREDMDSVWSGIEKSLKDMFPSKTITEPRPVTNWPKYLKIAGIFLLVMGVSFALYHLFESGSNGSRDRQIDPPVIDTSTESTSDFAEGSQKAFSADFSEWHTAETEHGNITLGFGNSYILRPNSNTWIGSGSQTISPAVENDFVFDVRFIVEEKQPSASIHFTLIGSGNDAEMVDLFFNIWNNESVVYTLTKGRLRSGGGLNVPHAITEETIAEREQLPPSLRNQDWSKVNKFTLKREGGKMHFFVNDIFVDEFNVSRFPVEKTSIGAAHQSKVFVTSIEGRTRN